MGFRGRMLGKIVLFVGIFFYATIPSYKAMPPFWTPNANAILQWSRPEGLQPERITDDPMDWKQPQEGSGEPLLLYNFEEPLVLNFGKKEGYDSRKLATKVSPLRFANLLRRGEVTKLKKLISL